MKNPQPRAKARGFLFEAIRCPAPIRKAEF